MVCGHDWLQSNEKKSMENQINDLVLKTKANLKEKSNNIY